MSSFFSLPRIGFFAVVFFVSFLGTASAFASTGSFVEVRSLAEFLAYAGRSDMKVRLAPGTYTLATPVVLSGSRSEYDLAGVVFEYRIAEVGKTDANVFRLDGDDLTVRGLKLEATGEEGCPKGHGRAVLINGHRATLQGVTVITRGSTPYGYGNLFGRGGSPVVKLRKFNGIVVRGNDTRLIGCTVVSLAFGHGIALHEIPQNTLIRDCTVTGSLRSTDEILRETSGPAFDNQFKMYTGAPIPPGKVISKSEDGIRVYGPKTKGVTIENTVVRAMRGGIGLEAALPPVRVTGSRVVECEYAYYVGTDAVILDSEADALHGPALVTFAAPGGDHPYPADHVNSRVELRILDTRSPSGKHPLARLGGRKHHIIVSSRPGDVPTSMAIEVVGGATFTSEIGTSFPRGGDKRPTEIDLVNRTGATVILYEDASACVVSTTGKVEDKGKGNKVVALR